MDQLFVGIDVGSQNNAVYLMKPDGEKYSSFRMQNNRGGAKLLTEKIVSAIQSQGLEGVVIGMEATSIYGDSLVYALREDGRLGQYPRKIHVLNPKQVNKFKESYPELPKNDDVDAFVIADKLRFGRITKEVYMDDYRYKALQTLTRARFYAVQDLTREKQRFANYLFLKCSGLAQDKDIPNTSATTIALIERFETVDALAYADLDELTAFIDEKGRNFTDPTAKAKAIQAAARNSYRLPVTVNSSVNQAMAVSIATMRALEKQIKVLDKIKEGEVQTLRFYNRAKGCIVVRKLDKNDLTPLAGVEFQITYSDGSYLDDDNGHLSSKGLYKTDSNGEIRISGVSGTLVITETKPLPGYVMDEGTRTQTVKVNPTDTQTITVYNTMIKGLTIIKKDEQTSERIPNVQMEVRKLNGEIIGTFTTDNNGMIQLPQAEKGWYEVVELKAAEGYRLDATPHRIEVKDGQQAVLEVTNRKAGSALIHKVDSLTGEGIFGVTFLVSDSRGNTVYLPGGSGRARRAYRNGREYQGHQHHAGHHRKRRVQDGQWRVAGKPDVHRPVPEYTVHFLCPSKRGQQPQRLHQQRGGAHHHQENHAGRSNCDGQRQLHLHRRGDCPGDGKCDGGAERNNDQFQPVHHQRHG